MLEVELKGVVTDEAGLRRRIAALGGRLLAEGRMIDVRFDDAARRLSRSGEVLRLRQEAAGGATLTWKGPTRSAEYKEREEVSTPVSDRDAARVLVERLGYVEVHRIERDVSEYALDRASLRFERYPVMDELLEVEGTPEHIEHVLERLGLRRAEFTSEPLHAFIARFERRTGRRARLVF